MRKEGWQSCPSSSSNFLQSLMEEQGLVDLGFQGHTFTWSNNRSDLANICERLDRGVANVTWRALFHRAKITHLFRGASDHAPLLIKTGGGARGLANLFILNLFGLMTLLVQTFFTLLGVCLGQVHLPLFFAIRLKK